MFYKNKHPKIQLQKGFEHSKNLKISAAQDFFRGQKTCVIKKYFKNFAPYIFLIIPEKTI